jgi:hypothetical protein
MRRRAPRSSRGACGARRPPDAILTELKFEQGRRRDLERERAELDGAERFAAPSHEVRKAEISVALSDLSAAPRRLNPAGAAGPPMARRLGSHSSPSRCLTVEFSGNGSYSPLFSRVIPLSVKGTEGAADAAATDRQAPDGSWSCREATANGAVYGMVLPYEVSGNNASTGEFHHVGSASESRVSRHGTPADWDAGSRPAAPGF